MATPEEVQAEFRNRHEKILQQQKAEEDRRNAIKANRMATATAGTFRGEAAGVVYMSGGAEGEGESEQQQMVVPSKKLGTYVAAAKKNTQFFTTYEPELIMEDLQKELL